MRKLWAVFKREYRETVRKPSFLVMTVLAPFLMAALMIVPALLAVKGMGERRVALLDGTGRLGDVAGALRKESPAGSSSFAGGGRRERDGGPAGKIVPEYVDLSAADLKNAVGHTARVYLRIPGSRRGAGKITVDVQGRSVEAAASTNGPEIPTGDQVRILGLVADDTFDVTPLVG